MQVTDCLLTDCTAGLGQGGAELRSHQRLRDHPHNEQAKSQYGIQRPSSTHDVLDAKGPSTDLIINKNHQCSQAQFFVLLPSHRRGYLHTLGVFCQWYLII